MTELNDDEDHPARKFNFNDLLEEKISAEDFVDLDNAIQSDPRVLLDYLAFMQIAGYVAAPKGIYANEQSLTTHLKSAQQAERTNRYFKLLYRRIAVSVSCVAVVATLIGLLAWQDFSNHLYPRLVANIEVVKPAVWKCEHSYYAGWKKISRDYNGLNQVSLKQNDVVSISSGLFKLTLDGGAVITIKGPAEFEALGKETLFINSGVFSVDVAAKSKKPIVGTPHGWFKDIGTTYCLDVVSDKHTDLHVLDGSVIFANDDQSFKDPNTTSLIKNHQAGRAILGNSKLTTIDYNPSEYLDVCRQFFGLEEFSSNVQLLANQANLNLNMGNLENNELVYLVPEKPALLTLDYSYKALTANQEAEHSEFAGFLTLPKNQGQNQKVLSYLVHRDLIGTADGPTLLDNKTTPYDTTITLKFKNPVLGVIDTSQELQQTDQLFGWKHISYPGLDDPGFIGRDIGAGCKLLLSEDRRTLTMYLPLRVSQAGAGKRMVDHLRILTLAE